MNKQDEKLLALIFQETKLKNQTLASEDLLQLSLLCIAHISKIQLKMDYANPLSIMEMICLILLALGKNPDQCGGILGISTQSVITYEKRIRKKLGARNRTHAFYLASVRGLLTVAA